MQPLDITVALPMSNATRVVVATAGTTDISVAEEAAVTLEAAHVPVDRLYDVGVAGLHRIIRALPQLKHPSVGCVIVCAGMDGALPSVVGGLVSVPVIAVPTSIGYGAAFGGVSALLTMLNSCSPGVGIVNIDNGFGAAALAFKCLRTAKTLPVS
jgi:pyridinium-3,5-biscarboxylic acid mononucleotide synthase